ncbi:MAG: AMP-binding protein [Planctomycetota bacterium]
MNQHTILERFEALVRSQAESRALGRVQRSQTQWWSWDRCASAVEDELRDLHTVEKLAEGAFVSGHDVTGVEWFARHLASWRMAGVTVGESFGGWGRPRPDQLASLVTTAGTSGEPRGVMLTHENLASNAVALSEASGGDGDELRLSFLPMEHLYARTCDLYTWIVRGSRLVLAESPKTVFRDARLVKPTVINGVPYFFQKAIDLADAEGVSLKHLLGGEIRRLYCGGAPLSPRVEERFADEGIPIYTGYGLTEASPVVTVNTPTAYKPGTVGRPLPGVEVRIAQNDTDTPGEVLVRGPNVMLGYWDDAEATAEVLRDGWLHTGDLGRLDDEGFLTITGRAKELIALATAKKVAPSRVEAMLCASPWIEQACVFGEGRKGLTALIVPSRERLGAEVRRRRLWVWSKRGALRHSQVRAIYREVIDECLASAALEERVHDFRLIGRGFDQARGEMTAKLSLRRTEIERSFERELTEMNG